MKEIEAETLQFWVALTPGILRPYAAALELCVWRTTDP